jgi:hypothetical protein
MFVLHAAKRVIKAGFSFVINNFLVQKDAVQDAEVFFKMAEMVDFDSFNLRLQIVKVLDSPRIA